MIKNGYIAKVLLTKILDTKYEKHAINSIFPTLHVLIVSDKHRNNGL